MSWIMRFLSSDIVIPFRVWGPRNSSHNGRKSKGITPECFDVRPLPCPHNPPRPLPPSRGEAASSKERIGVRRNGTSLAVRLSYQRPDTKLEVGCFAISSLELGQEDRSFLLGSSFPHDFPSVQRLTLAGWFPGGSIR